MPPPVRERYNAKARGSVAGGSSHKSRKRKARRDDGEAPEEKVTQPHHEVGMSSKKRKRLDSYIHKKLQLERRDETLKTLASLQNHEASMNMLSTAGLGQNPFAPTTAAERLEIAEDKAVRRGIEKLKRRHGEEADSDSDDEPKRGTGRPVEVITTAGDEDETVATTVLETKAERKAREKAEARGSGKIAMGKGKKSNWNPALAKKKGESDSDFDSSDSGGDSSDEDDGKDKEDEEDEEDEEERKGPSEAEEKAIPPSATIGSALKASTGSAFKPAATGSALKPTAGSALKPTAGSALKPTAGSALKSATGSALKSSVGSALKVPTGSALKTGADGSVYQPRVVIRGPKKFAPARRREESGGEEEDEELESSDYDSDGDSEDDSEDDSDDDEDASDQSDGESGSADEDEDEEGSEGDAEAEATPKKRANFKEWALKQMGTASATALAPDLLATTSGAKKDAKPAVKVGEFIAPMGAEYHIPTESLLTGSEQHARPELKRRPSVVESRMELPILAEEQGIVEAVLMNPVVIICGETGSGKTTQVPQMLYEAGFGFPGSSNPGMVAVTQPRRVAAVSLAERVRDEMGLSPKSGVVAHQIRYSSTTAPDTAIKFMTDGVLLRELASDFLLSRYSVVVVDEAHERGVNTDVLIGVLSRVAKLREKRWRETKDKPEAKDRVSPLRLVIMSATLRVADFAENATLFATPPPIIHIGARQHPVTIHFSRRTVSDYVGEAYKKVSKIHARLPPGTILVFLTGQSEIMQLCRKLEAKYGDKGKGGKGKGKKKESKVTEVEEGMLAPEVVEAEDVDLGGDRDLAADVDDGVAESDDEALDTDEEDEPALELEDTDMPMTVLPLYSLLSQEAQMAVFKPPPEGHRLVIVSTNVAETSLTIPGVRYVVDSGRAKERQYDHASGVQTFAVSWISKASAAQRAGRAGRTGPGHCYRLYSSALFEDHMPAFGEPEILRMPIEGVVLNMKAMNIDAVVNFPFPTPPDRQALRRAEALLTHLGALARPVNTRMVSGIQKAGASGGQITELGRVMAAYPVSPRFAKMLAVGAENGCLPFVIAIVAGLSVGDPFIHEAALDGDSDEEEDEDRARELAGFTSEAVRAKEKRKDLRSRFFRKQAAFDSKDSDLFKLLSAIGAYEHNPTPAFCHEYFLRPKAMQEIQQLRVQISRIAQQPLERMSPPSDRERKVLRQILCAGFIDQVAVLESIVSKKGSSVHGSARGIPYRALGVPEPVFIHPSSVLFHHTPPDYVVFSEVVRTARVCLKGVTRVQGSWLAVLGKDMCTFSRPLETPGMRAKVLADKSRGKENPNEREVIVVPHFADLGVDLPPIKRKQVREGTRWITLDE